MSERTQFDEENDLGRGGGEVSEETLEEARREAQRRRGSGDVEDDDPDAAA